MIHGHVIIDTVNGYAWERITTVSYNPNLQAPKANTRAEQRRRYDNLAAFMYKITTVNGRHQYSEAGLRRLLVGSRVLTREGHVNHDRLNRLAKSLGVHSTSEPSRLPEIFEDYEYGDTDLWDDILEYPY